MFGNDKKQAAADKRIQAARDGGVTILTAGCHFAGKLYCKGATRIGGTIEGEIIAEGVLIVELEAVVNAVVKAEEIVVHGRIEGSLNVSGRLELCSTADMQAEVTTPNLIVHEGAIFNGRTTMKRPAAATDAGPRNGKGTRELKTLKSDTTSIDAEAERPGHKAARVPEISFA